MGIKLAPSRIKQLRDEGKFYITAVDEETVTSLIEWMGYAIGQGKKIFTLLISSPGGSPTWMIHFASFLRTVPKDVQLHGIAIGECGSAALALLQCCHKRSATLHTAFYPHHVQCTLKMNCQQTMTEIIAYVEREIAQARLLEVELVRIQSARMGITPEEWMKIAEVGEQCDGINYLTDDALRLNLIDEVLEHYPLL